MNEKDKLYDAKVRWQETRVKQLSFVTYLILTLSVAALGFAVSLLPDENFDRVICFSCIYWLSLFLFVVSTGLGIWCAINRLRDFRATARIAKLKYENGHQREIDILRFFTNRLGKSTWVLLCCQIGFFGAGILAVMFAIFSCQLINFFK